MPNCFTLTRKSDPDAGPVAFAKIDEEICAHLDVPCHPKHWYLGWYDDIGMALAHGMTFERMREIYEEDREVQAIKVVDFLDENFTANAWAEIGRRS